MQHTIHCDVISRQWIEQLRLFTASVYCAKGQKSGTILSMGSANEKWHYILTWSLIGHAHTQNMEKTLMWFLHQLSLPAFSPVSQHSSLTFNPPYHYLSSTQDLSAAMVIVTIFRRDHWWVPVFPKGFPREPRDLNALHSLDFYWSTSTELLVDCYTVSVRLSAEHETWSPGQIACTTHNCCVV